MPWDARVGRASGFSLTRCWCFGRLGQSYGFFLSDAKLIQPTSCPHPDFVRITRTSARRRAAFPRALSPHETRYAVPMIEVLIKIAEDKRLHLSCLHVALALTKHRGALSYGDLVAAIRAVSAVILAKPEWANTGLRWFEVLDNLDLMAMSDRAKPFYQGADVLAGMITEAVRREFEPQNVKPVSLSRSIIRLCAVAPRQ